MEKEYNSILITIPSSIDWGEYQKELDIVKDGEQVMNFKVNFLPKNVKEGDRCYLVYKGNIVGWMEIVGLSSNSFACSTTGKVWTGNFIQRSGEFHKINPYPYKGFQGFRYFDDSILNN